MQVSATKSQPQQPVLQTVPDLPPEPHCVSWSAASPCALLKQQYQAALQKRQQIQLQNYVETQKAQAAQNAAAQASAPLQQQITDLQSQNSALQGQLQQLRVQLQQQETAAVQAKQTAHDEGFWEGLYRGAGGVLTVALIAVAIVYAVKRLRGRYAVVQTSEKTQGASA